MGNGSERERERAEAVQLRASVWSSVCLAGSTWLAWLGLWVLRCLQRQPWGINNENMQALLLPLWLMIETERQSGNGNERASAGKSFEKGLTLKCICVCVSAEKSCKS